MNSRIQRRKTPRSKALWTQLPSALKEAADTQTARMQRQKPRKRIASKSAEQTRRDRLYAPLAKWFKEQNPKCQCCAVRRHPLPGRATRDVHHVKGKSAALLFYFPWFKGVCGECHAWIGDNPDAARGVGMHCDVGEWNKQPDESVWLAKWKGGNTYVTGRTESHAALKLPTATPPFSLTLLE